jgi:hypothetical protein
MCDRDKLIPEIVYMYNYPLASATATAVPFLQAFGYLGHTRGPE